MAGKILSGDTRNCVLFPRRICIRLGFASVMTLMRSSHLRLRSITYLCDLPRNEVWVPYYCVLVSVWWIFEMGAHWLNENIEALPKSPPALMDGAAREPFDANTIQSTRCAKRGWATARSFRQSPGCRHGFLTTKTSTFVRVVTPFRGMETRTCTSPSFKTL